MTDLVRRADVPWTNLVRPANVPRYLFAAGFATAIAAPLLLYVSWSLLGRGAPRDGVLEFDLFVAALFGVVTILTGIMGTNLGIELKEAGVVRYWTTGLTRDPIWREEYPWDSLSVPDQGFYGTWFYAGDDPFQVARNQGDAIVSDSRYLRKGNRAPADMSLRPGG